MLGRHLAVTLACLLTSCPAAVAPKALYKVARTYPHETRCFTEGLFMNGSTNEVFESCGGYGQSYLRKYNLETGLALGHVAIPSEIFSEGLALLGGKLYMLTYQSHVILEFDASSLAVGPTRHPFPYGEGWGLTTDGCDLLATTGSALIYRLRLDAAGRLQLVSSLRVTHNGAPLTMLNEIEYVTPSLWINQWHTNTLWRVNAETGVSEMQLDISGLHAWSGERTPNGIAYSNSFGITRLLVTGKLWPNMFALELSPQDLCDTGAKPPSCVRAPVSACWNAFRSKESTADVTALLSAAPSLGVLASGAITRTETRVAPSIAAGASSVSAVAAHAEASVVAPVIAAGASEHVPVSLAAGGSSTRPLHGSVFLGAAFALMFALALMIFATYISLRRYRYRLLVQPESVQVKLSV